MHMNPTNRGTPMQRVKLSHTWALFVSIFAFNFYSRTLVVNLQGNRRACTGGSCDGTSFLRSSDWSEFTCRHFGLGLSSYSDLLWFLGLLCMIFAVKFSEFLTWKTILLINFYFFTKNGKWKRDNGIDPVHTKLTTDEPSINQSIERTTTDSTPNIVQVLTAAFHGH